jgi:hypothetical protein
MHLSRHELRLVREALRYTLLSALFAQDGCDPHGHPVPWTGDVLRQRTGRDLLGTLDTHLDGYDHDLRAALAPPGWPAAPTPHTPHKEEHPR